MRDQPSEARRKLLAVLGPRSTSSGWTEELSESALEVGKWAAENGWVLITGGLSGSGHVATQACRRYGGLTLAFPPHDEDESGADIVIPTRLGVYRNFVIAHAADAGVAIGGGLGTLQEASQLHDLGRPVGALGVQWFFPGLRLFADHAELEREFLKPLASGSAQSQPE